MDDLEKSETLQAIARFAKLGLVIVIVVLIAANMARLIVAMLLVMLIARIW